MVYPRAVVIGFIVQFLSLAGTVPLKFEALFPETSYKRAYRACIDTWYQLRMAKRSPLQQEQLCQFNDAIVDRLVQLDDRVQAFMNHAEGISPDDLEYLMGIVQLMHNEYVIITGQQINNDYAQAAVWYFFNRIKDKLERFLPQ